jgi:hypothetical protein
MQEIFHRINSYFWQPSIGDPPWITTLIVYLYWCAALLCFVHAVRLWRHTSTPIPDQVPSAKRERLYLVYGLQATLIFLLGVGKQTNLGNRITSFGRMWASAHGWYSFRHPVQEDLITSILIGGGLLLVTTGWLLRHTFYRHGPLILGVMGLLTYTAIRMVSLHDVDSLIYSRVYGIRWDWIFELGALLFINGALVVAFPRRQRKATLPV